MKLNAYTNGFAGQASTQAGKRPRYIEWVYYQNPFDGVTVFDDCWMYEPEAAGVPAVGERKKRSGLSKLCACS